MAVTVELFAGKVDLLCGRRPRCSNLHEDGDEEWLSTVLQIVLPMFDGCEIERIWDFV